MIRILLLFLTFFLFMSQQTWDGLSKNATDDETIEQAIDRLIAVHESDSTSHLGVGESLQAHKNADVIDHPAFSILDDKFAYDQNIYNLSFAYLSLYDKSAGVENNGLDTAYMYSANSLSPQWIYGFLGDMLTWQVFAYERTPRFITTFMVTNTTSQLGYILAGYRDEYLGYGFKILNNKLYGMYYKSDHSEHTVELITLVSATAYRVECRVISNTQIDFYINNVLAGSITNAVLVSSTTYGLNIPWIDWKSTTTTSRELFIKDFLWSAQLP